MFGAGVDDSKGGDDMRPEPVNCPECGEKTQTYVYPDTVLRHFPLYCRRCKKQFNIDKN